MELTESNSLEEDLQKAISTAERRKVRNEFSQFKQKTNKPFSS